MKQDIRTTPVKNTFYGHIYPMFAKEFLLGNDYEKFAGLVGDNFILTSDQWGEILKEWEEKEQILAD